MTAWVATATVTALVVVAAVFSSAIGPGHSGARLSVAASGSPARCGITAERLADHLVDIDFVGRRVGYGLDSVPGASARAPSLDELVITGDGGRKWVPRCPAGAGVFSAGFLGAAFADTGVGLQDLSFVNGETGYLRGSPGVAVTGDSGRRWALTLSGDVTAFAATTRSTRAAVTSCRAGTGAGPVCRTTVVTSRDGGTEWRAVDGTGSSRSGGSMAIAAITTDAAVFAALPPGRETSAQEVTVSAASAASRRARRLSPFWCPAYTTGVGLQQANRGRVLWATCMGGNGLLTWLVVRRSTDGGASWATGTAAGAEASVVTRGLLHTVGGWQPTELVVVSADRAALVEAFGNPSVGPAGVYVTADGGSDWRATWSWRKEGDGGQLIGATLDFVGTTLGWLAIEGQPGGPRGGLLETTTGGDSWRAIGGPAVDMPMPAARGHRRAPQRGQNRAPYGR